jgi:hypothetical protein
MTATFYLLQLLRYLLVSSLFSIIRAKTRQQKWEIAGEKSLFPCFLAKDVLKADKPVFSLLLSIGRRDLK